MTRSASIADNFLQFTLITTVIITSIMQV